MKDAIKILDDVAAKIQTTPNKSVIEKLDAVLSKNKGLQVMKDLAANNISALKKHQQFQDPSPGQLSVFKFAPIVSVVVERSFSVYKNILAASRRSFKIENLRRYMLVNCFGNFGSNVDEKDGC